MNDNKNLLLRLSSSFCASFMLLSWFCPAIRGLFCWILEKFLLRLTTYCNILLPSILTCRCRPNGLPSFYIHAISSISGIYGILCLKDFFSSNSWQFDMDYRSAFFFSDATVQATLWLFRYDGCWSYQDHYDSFYHIKASLTILQRPLWFVKHD